MSGRSDTAPGATRLPSLGRVRHLWIAGLAVYLGIVWYLGIDRIGGAIEVMELRFVVALAAVETASLWLRALKWRLVLGPNADAMRNCFISKAGGNLTPARVGEFSPLFLKGTKRSKVGAWILADRLMEASATLLLGLLGFAIVLGFASGGGLMLWAAGILGGAALAAFAFARIESLANRYTGGDSESLAAKAAGVLVTAGREFRLLGPKVPLFATLTLAATALDLVVGLLLYAAFGFWVAFAVLAVAQCVHALTSVVPLTPNATGVPYVAAAAVLNQIAGVPAEVLAAAVGVRFVVGNTVFWTSFAAALSIGRRAGFRSQDKLFDTLASGAVLYDYAPDALEKLNGLVPNKGRMLDIGCGDGVIGAALDSPDRFGIEISPACARHARDRGIRCSLADATRGLPFRDEAFDTVYCVDVLHHLGQQWDRVFPELDRVLRDGGRLAIVEPDARNPFVRWTQAPGSPVRVAPWHDEPAIDPAELLPHLAGLGYDFECSPIHIEGAQAVRTVFPLWQRIAKAPFVLALGWVYRNTPNKFALLAHKPAAENKKCA